MEFVEPDLVAIFLEGFIIGLVAPAEANYRGIVGFLDEGFVVELAVDEAVIGELGKIGGRGQLPGATDGHVSILGPEAVIQPFAPSSACSNHSPSELTPWTKI